MPLRAQRRAGASNLRHFRLPALHGACFGFSLAYRLLALIVLLVLAGFFISGSDCMTSSRF